MKQIKKTNVALARKFGHTFRYIDDLLAINDSSSFERHHHDIYPIELELSKENVGTTSTTFLDLDIEIVDGSFNTKLYDKRDNFGFHITRLPFRKSNIPARMFYSSISAECLRICRATSSSNQAITSIHSIKDRMISEGADFLKMKNSIIKILKRHDIGQKFGKTFFENLF